MELPGEPARRGWRGGALGEGLRVSGCVCVWFFQVGRRAEAGGGWVRETCWEGGSPGGEAVTPPSALLPSVEFPESEDSVTTMFSVERRNYGGARAGWLPSPQACRR